MSDEMRITKIKEVGEGLYDIHLSNGTVLKSAYLTSWNPEGMTDFDNGSMTVDITITGHQELKREMP